MTAKRKCAFLVWELGDNFGHVAKLVALSDALKSRGIDVFVAVQNLTGVAPLITDNSFTLLQAPYARVRPIQEAGFQVLTYADELLPCGYQRPEELAALIRAWDSLYAFIKPDVVIANSAPTALLAAHTAENFDAMIKVSIGLGYEVPAISVPMPPLRFWEKTDTGILQQHENRVVTTINTALDKLGRRRIQALGDMLQTDFNYLTTFPEIDHYPSRTGGAYVGPLFVDDKGVEIDWLPREIGRRRIFAYLSHGPHINAVIQALRLLPHDIILVARRLSEDQAASLRAANLRVFTEPVKIGRLAGDADLCMTHGGTSTLVQFLNKGVPQILFPNHIEQFMVSVRLHEYGTAAMVTAPTSPNQIAALIQQTLMDEKIRAKAQSWAAKYGHYAMGSGIARICDDIAHALAKKQ